MAYKEEIIIDVIQNGIEVASNNLKNLKQNTNDAGRANSNMASSVLENGGAMGLLIDATGGLAMSIKDGVEAFALFTKGSALASTAQKIFTFVVGTTTGGMKLLRIALASTGIGLIVVGIGLLIANFDAVKKTLEKLFPPFAFLAKIIPQIAAAITDFLGLTSDATRALDQMVEKSKESLARNEHFLDANGDKYDQYTRKKLQANIDYNKKVIELSKQFEDGEIKSQAELNSKLSDFRGKANRAIVSADKERADEAEKKQKEINDKQADIAKANADKAKAEAQKRADAEKARVDALAKINEEYLNKMQDLDAKSDQQKRDLEEQRKLKEIDTLKGTEAQKKSVRDYYDRLEKEANELKVKEQTEIELNRVNAGRQLVLDQKEWEIENEVDPLVKLQKQRELLELQAELDLEKLQYTIDTADADSQAKLDAQTAFNQRTLDKTQALADNESAIAEQKKEVVKKTEEAKKAILLSTLDFAQGSIALFKDLAGENKAMQKAALLANSAVSIAQIIANTNVGSAKEVATKGIFGLSTSAILYAKMGLSIASVVAATAKGLQGIGAGGGSASGGGDAAGGGSAAPAAPSFNLVQGTGANQVAGAIAGQNRPIQAFVVSTNVTTAQSMDRNIIENSKF